MSSVEPVPGLETCGVDDCIDCAQRDEAALEIGPRELSAVERDPDRFL